LQSNLSVFEWEGGAFFGGSLSFLDLLAQPRRVRLAGVRGLSGELPSRICSIMETAEIIELVALPGVTGPPPSCGPMDAPQLRVLRLRAQLVGALPPSLAALERLQTLDVRATRCDPGTAACSRCF
jgi:hypothetical protein